MKKRLIIEKKDNITKHYLRSYWGKIPLGFKVISEVFETLKNGDIAYTKYSEDGSCIIEEGFFCLNSQTKEMQKVGKWRYYTPKFKYYKISWKDEIYNENGKKIQENHWGEHSCKTKIWKDNGVIVLSNTLYGFFEEISVIDTVNGTKRTNVLDCKTKQLVRQTYERGFNPKTETYRQASVYSYVSDSGRLLCIEHKLPSLKNVYITERYPLDKPAYFEYSEVAFGHPTILFSSFNKEEVYKFYVMHLKLSKRDNKKRRSVIEKLRSFPTLKAKKEFLRKVSLSQTQNYKGA